MGTVINVLKLDRSNAANVFSAIEQLSFPAVEISLSQVSELEDGASLIIPGVGHISALCQQVDREIKTNVLKDLIKSKNLYVIGICLGFHFLCRSTEEDPSADCLGAVPIAIKKLHENCAPEVGWRIVRRLNGSTEGPQLFTQEGDYFYFSHSYGSEDRDQNAHYYEVAGRSIMAFYKRDRIVGMQFHPEKSGCSGLDLFRAILLDNRLANVSMMKQG